MIRELTFLFFLLLFNSPMRGQLSLQTAEKILSDLYESTKGNVQVGQPSIVISENQRSMAAYSHRANEIRLERKALEVCETFGPDAENALAFLIGHELIHCFQEAKGTTNFLTDAHSSGDPEGERIADIRGAFTAKMAGYDPSDIIADLIDGLYEAYNLKDESMPAYPPLAVRQATAEYVMAHTDTLWHIFQTGNYMATLQQYELAIKTYAYILKYYSGKETFNNIGLLYAKQALTFSGKNVDPYLYPFEMDTKSRLADARSEDLSLPEQEARQQYIDQANRYFKRAKDIDPYYVPAHLNQLSVLSMSGEADEVIRQFQKGKIETFLRRSKADTRERESIRLAVANAYALSSKANPQHHRTAQKLLDELQGSPSPQIQTLAQYNKERLAGRTNMLRTSNNCSLAGMTSQNIDDVSPMSHIRKSGIFLDEDQELEIYWEELKESTVFVTKYQGDHTFVLQQVRTPGLVAPGNIQVGYRAQTLLQQAKRQEYSIFSANNGYYLHIPTCQVIFHVSTKDKIDEWVKYF